MKIKKILSATFLLIFALISPSLIYADEQLGTFAGLGENTIFNRNSIEEPAGIIERILSSVVGFMTILGGLWFLIQMLVGGLNWAGAGGDTQKVDQAKKKMTNGAIGLIIMVAAYAITFIIGRILGYDILQFSSTLQSIKS